MAYLFCNPTDTQTIALPPISRFWSFLSSSNVVEFDVPLLTSYTPAVSNLLAYIQLGRQDGWRNVGRGEGREISVLAASLRGVVKHQGVRCVVFVWFLCVYSTRTRYGS